MRIVEQILGITKIFRVHLSVSREDRERDVKKIWFLFLVFFSFRKFAGISLEKIRREEYHIFLK